MAAKKVTRKVSTRSHADVSGMSYDTKIVIVVILLVFAYPIGLALMWAWMRDWPMWLRIFITLPLILGIIFLLGFLAIIGQVVKEAVHNSRIEMQQQATPSAVPNTQVSPTLSPRKAY